MRKWTSIAVGVVFGLVQVWCLINGPAWGIAVVEFVSKSITKVVTRSRYGP